MMVEPSEVTDMDLYLMQHGQATETEDRERPLTDAGRAAVQRVAELKEPGLLTVGISGCLHSGKLRAEQTAQLLVTEVHLFVGRFFSLIERRILVIDQRG
jgi:phosphohistidine phosphatase SixA